MNYFTNGAPYSPTFPWSVFDACTFRRPQGGQPAADDNYWRQTLGAGLIARHRQRPSRFFFSVKVAESPPSLVQKNSAQKTWRPRDWVTNDAVQATFWGRVTVFNFKCAWSPVGNPNRCNLGGGSVWDVVEQPGPGEDRRLRFNWFLYSL